MSRVFVVDDDKGWLDYHERLLVGYDVESFGDGVAVMERMQEMVPDVLVLDILLVGPTGFSVLNEMQSYEDLARVPVIVVSSAAMDEDLGEYGVVRVFDKGKMLPDELLEAVKECCGECKN